MSSTVLSKLFSIAFLCIATGSVSAETPPRVLQDPLLGLRYEPARIHFEPAPAKIVSQCPSLAGDEHISGVWFVFARAGDATGRIFYLLNGYHIRSRPKPPDFPRYSIGRYGMLVMVRGHECEVIDADARQSFDDRLFIEELPQHILQGLATDFAARLGEAFGGKDRLRSEIANQRTDLEALPEELRVALQDIRSK